MKHQRWIRLLAPLGLAVSLASFAAGTPAPDTTVPAVGIIARICPPEVGALDIRRDVGGWNNAQ